MLNKILRTIEKFIPKKLYKAGQPIYHYLLAVCGALLYGFPARHLKVVGITGTKGKTSTAEFVNAVLEAAGKKTALAGTLRFKIGENSKPNLHKMTMPGRFFIQKFLRQAAHAGCEYAILEISSEAAAQFRHKFLDLDALIFTNLAPEHIESHGSFERYLSAKLSITKELEASSKKDKIIIANADDKEGEKFLRIDVEHKAPFSMKEAKDVELSDNSISFVYKNQEFYSVLRGRFNISNMLAAIKYGEFEGIGLNIAAKGIESLAEIKGRAQIIKISDKQKFEVVVDYAHTAESLQAIYEAFPGKKIIGVLGATGGGRDKWKRKAMAEVAEKFCSVIILTDEDPYNDDPMSIIENLAHYFTKKIPEKTLSRREAIARALRLADEKSVVIITGKGTDPFIMRANGEKEPWSDAEVAREELKKVLV